MSLHYLVKYKFSKFAPTAVTQQQIMHSCTKENVTMADKLVLRKEDETQIRHSTHPVAHTVAHTVCCHVDHFSWWSRLEATPTEDLTGAVSYVTQLLNDVIFIWFTDKNLFALATMKNSHNNQLQHYKRGKKQETHWSKMLSLHKNDVQSFADDACQCVKIWQHLFDITQSQSQSQWNLLL